MRVSDEGLLFISKWEGEILHEYDDVVGKRTIGIGHLLLRGESFPNGISHEQALDILRSDIAIAEKAVNDLVNVEISQNAFNALCSFVFNLGSDALRKSTLLTYLNAGCFINAADEFPKWCKAGGVANTGLLNRRKSERLLFLQPDNSSIDITPEIIPPTIERVPKDEPQADEHLDAPKDLLTYMHDLIKKET